MSPIAKRAVKIREARDLLTGKRVNLSEMYTRDALARGLGTAWVAPGEGSTWRALVLVFGKPHPRMIDWRTNRIYQDWRLDKSTNLLLTGLPLQEADRERWESGSVR
jgi:hypothetical protein